MAFSDYMKSLPNIRLETIKQLAKACRVNVNDNAKVYQIII